MIVCVCSRVNTSQIQEAQKHTNTFEYVCATTGACRNCGLCQEMIHQMVVDFPGGGNENGSIRHQQMHAG